MFAIVRKTNCRAFCRMLSSSAPADGKDLQKAFLRAVSNADTAVVPNGINGKHVVQEEVIVNKTPPSPPKVTTPKIVVPNKIPCYFC